MSFLDVSVSSHIYIFVCALICGALISLVFDAFRIFRKMVKTSPLTVAIHDVVFWLLAALMLFGYVFLTNNGELRLFEFAGVFLGAIIYFLTLSKTIISLSINLIKFLNAVLTFIIRAILLPISFIYRLLRRPLILAVNISGRNIRRSKRGVKRVAYSFGKNLRNFNKFIKKT